LIKGLEEELFKQTVRGSPEAVSMLLADNFIEFGRSGGVYRKDEVVRSLAAEIHEINAPKRTATDFKLTSLADDVVLLTYRSVRRFTDSGQEQAFIAEFHLEIYWRALADDVFTAGFLTLRG
jgi:hypothetical protein